MDLKKAKIAILLENTYQELEFWYPYFRFKEAGAEVTVVAPAKGQTYNSKTGYPAKSDVAADEVDVTKFDAVIVPGGFAPDFMRRTPAMVGVVREAYEKGKIVAAICHAGWILISADLLRNKRATSFFSIKDDMINAGAQYLDQEVVRDGNLITSRLPDDLPAFCREIISALEEVGAPKEAARA